MADADDAAHAPPMTDVVAPTVALRAFDPADGAETAAVVAAAVSGARPREVMPPDDSPDADDWTLARERAYARFLRARPAEETSYLVVEGAAVVGVARLRHDPAGVETGVWLVRPARGRGIGTVVLGLLVERAAAAGAQRLVADTTPDNVAAVASLRRHGADLREQAGTVAAVVDLGAVRTLRARGSSR
jgi:RimJ/RimL family protein N-acetyltransferase